MAISDEVARGDLVGKPLPLVIVRMARIGTTRGAEVTLQ